MPRIHWGVGKIRWGALFRNEERDASGWISEVFLDFVFSKPNWVVSRWN